MFNINEVIEKKYSSADKRFRKKIFNKRQKFVYLIFQILKLLLTEIVGKIYHLIFPSNPEDISKQLALVTGGANGLGREICLRLAQENCDIAVVDLDYQNALSTAKEIEEKFPVKCRAFQCDISNYSAVLELKDKVEEEMKSVDILVNNAGLLFMSNFLTSTIKDMQRVVDVNLTSQFMMVHTFLPSMIAQKRGKIVSIASTASINPIPTAVVYTSTKFAVNGFMRCLQDELSYTDKDEFIKFTTVFPDFINTRKELSDVLDEIEYIFPRLSPKRVADETVKGILINKENILISDMKISILILSFLPSKVRKMAFKLGTNIKALSK